VARVVTSIRVDDELWKEAKIYAIRKGITLTELIEGLLKDELIKSGVLVEEMKA
jgi:predicted DNA-binding ribbon-helix-helix protein